MIHELIKKDKIMNKFLFLLPLILALLVSGTVDAKKKKYPNGDYYEGEWKKDAKLYEHVQGVVIDIRFLMNNYTGSHKSKIRKLAKVIDEELAKNNGSLPEVD